MKRALAFLLGIAVVPPALGAAFTLSDTPLFISTGVAPNIVLTLDDSLSMPAAAVPDDINSDSATKRYKSAYFNSLYYNPALTYTPPPRFNGTECRLDSDSSTCYPNVPFTAAPINGFQISRDSSGTNASSNCNPAGAGDNSPVNLSSNYAATTNYNPKNTTQSCAAADPISGSYKAYYYLFYTTAGVAKPGACATNPLKEDDDCYVKIEVGSASDIAGKNNSAITAEQQSRQKAVSATWPWTSTQQKQNFANWYSYYRTRNLATVSGAMRAFANMDGNARLAWQALDGCNSFSTTCQGWSAAGNSSPNFDNRMRRLDAINTGAKTHKEVFYEWLARLQTDGSTHLTKAADRAGVYFGGTVDVNHPLAEDPQITQGTLHACRRNISLIMTDGGWCGDTGGNAVSVGDANSVATTLPVPMPSADGLSTVSSWTPGAPYRDGQGNNMADIAFKYWVMDAQSTQDNIVPKRTKDLSGSEQTQWLNPKNDPATWQHVNTYTVGLGLSNTMTGTPFSGQGEFPIWQGSTFASSVSGDGFSNLSLGTGCVEPPATGTAGNKYSKFCWPLTTVGESCPPSNVSQQRKVYDLWHAAIAGRGQFFSAESPDDVASAFKNILTEIAADTASSASLAANSTRLETGTIIYQAKFDSRDWSGQLIAFPVQGDGSIGSAKWNAALKVPAAGSRKIFTPGLTGKNNFEWANLTTAQQTALNKDFLGTADTKGQDRVAWIRGDHSKEQRFTGGTFRNRKKSIQDEYDLDADGNTAEYMDFEWILGDIINSNPIYVGSQSEGYSSLPGGTPGQDSYAGFSEFKKTRQPVIYVGANDGMLHAIQADIDQPGSGAELFAVIPNAAYANLHKLPDTNYSHLYYLDGSPNSGDAYLNNALSDTSGWNTVVVQTMGGGGGAVFAVDATKTDLGSIAATKFMWEFTDTDMGYTMGQAQIGRLNNGQWAAIFSNGYKASGGGAHLYIVNLSTGALIKKITASGGADNGLSTPAVLDTNGDKTIDYVYAGDLNGNVWKFDLSSVNYADWDVAYSGSPLFVAQHGAAKQPITVQPALMLDPSVGGYWVYFGTGRFFGTNDDEVLSIPNEPMQSIYGIWDNQSSAITYSNRTDILVQQGINQEVVSGDYSYRLTSNNAVALSPTVRGWFMDLAKAGTTDSVGERVVSRAITVQDNLNAANSRVIFVTLIPNDDPCKTGGDSWLMEFSLYGGQPSSPVFDVNANGSFDDGDKISGYVPTGIKSTVGIVPTPTWVDKDAGIAFKLLSGTSGGIMSIMNRGRGEQAGTPVRIYWYQIL